MLYDRMCKKIFRVDGMLLPLPCIQASIKSFRLSYEKNRENIIETRCMFEFSMKLYSMLVYEKLYPLYIIIFHFLKENDKIASFLIYFCISCIRDSNRWNSYMSRICYVFQILFSNELEKSCNMILVMVSWY